MFGKGVWSARRAGERFGRRKEAQYESVQRFPMDRDVPTNSEFVSWQDGDVDATKLNSLWFTEDAGEVPDQTK